ncbi:MAG: hypothetical protein RLZZ196_3582 [Bacteroidota bacterium]|jgi:hypothetical protein
MEKKRFLFYTSWRKNIDMMDDVELRRFINNLCNYAEDKQIDLPTRIEQMVWNDVVEVLNHNETKRLKTIEKRSEAGKKGGAPVGNTNAQKKTDVDETNKNNQNNQMVELQTKQTKQPEERSVLSEECKEISEGCNMLKDVRNKVLDIMKQVIEDTDLTEEEVMNWKISDTREKLNYIFEDYPNWENDFWELGLDAFIRKASFKSNIEINYIVYDTLKAHLIL